MPPGRGGQSCQGGWGSTPSSPLICASDRWSPEGEGRQLNFCLPAGKLSRQLLSARLVCLFVCLFLVHRPSLSVNYLLPCHNSSDSYRLRTTSTISRVRGAECGHGSAGPAASSSLWRPPSGGQLEPARPPKAGRGEAPPFARSRCSPAALGSRRLLDRGPDLPGSWRPGAVLGARRTDDGDTVACSRPDPGGGDHRKAWTP